MKEEKSGEGECGICGGGVWCRHMGLIGWCEDKKGYVID
jgi:hypothetical protein